MTEEFKQHFAPLLVSIKLNPDDYYLMHKTVKLYGKHEEMRVVLEEIAIFSSLRKEFDKEYYLFYAFELVPGCEALDKAGIPYDYKPL